MNLDAEIADALLAQDYPFKFKMITKALEFTVRSSSGFIPAEQYSPMMEPVTGEIGCNRQTRYVVVR